jgi:aspartyl-tRNA(Asn)/glutamyl-tRNA(Gln) amidotransferase subunit B
MFGTGRGPGEIVAEKGLAMVSDEDAIAVEVDKAIAANPDMVAKIRAGNDKVIAALMGQVMKATRGQAKPDVVSRLLAERLKD